VAAPIRQNGSFDHRNALCGVQKLVISLQKSPPASQQATNKHIL